MAPLPTFPVLFTVFFFSTILFSALQFLSFCCGHKSKRKPAARRNKDDRKPGAVSKDPTTGPVWTKDYQRVKGPKYGKVKIYVPPGYPKPIYVSPDPEQPSPPYTIVSLGRIQQMVGAGSAKDKMKEKRTGRKVEEKKPADDRGKKTEHEEKTMQPETEADYETIRNMDTLRDYGLKVSPIRLVFDSTVPEEPVKLELWNTTEMARAVKFKCNDAVIFRVKPPYLLIKPGERSTIVINRLQAPPKPDIIEIVTVEVPQSAKLDKKDLAYFIKHTAKEQLLVQRIEIDVK